MAEVTQEKSRGLKFAEEQLRRHGWEQGKGLGRAEDGIAEAIKVKVKCNKGGVGHKESEQFTFHWWDHVFNKASSRLQVESDQDGVVLKKTVEEGEEDDSAISNKKPRAAAAKAKLYGCFVKSATLLSGQERPEPKPANTAEDDDSSSSSSSSDEEDDQKLDLSSTTKLSDAELMKACGGRTAHKGARHGLTMSAKLARLEQQEAEFMAKYGKKSQTKPDPDAAAPPTAQSADPQEETNDDPPSKKKKKKKKVTDEDTNAAFENTETDIKPKKKKNKAVEEEVPAAMEVTEDTEKVKKHKKKKNAVEQNGEDADKTAEKMKKKKKKSFKRQSEEAAEEEQSADAESSQSELAEEEPQSKKKRKKEQACVRDEEEVPPKKKKKKKKSKESQL